MTTYQNPVSVFLSYAHEDELWLKELLKHLSLLKWQGLISTWYDRQIVPGTDWAEVIDQRLEQASIILLLVSADFLASDYCYQIEMKRALERHQAGEARVIPIAVRPADWKGAPFASLHALPTNARAISTWSDRDNAFVDVVAGIRRAIDDLSLFSASTSDVALPTMEIKGSVTNSDHARPSAQPRLQRFGKPFPAVWNVSRRHTPFFTGRDHMLQQLADGFRLESGVEIVLPQAITGLGGMGKTQTAAEYAYRFRGDYEAVLWVRAETQEILIADFKTIAGLLKRPREHVQDRTSLIQTMQEWFRNHADWLLIFDNADSLTLVDPFLPRSGRGHILVTTRAGAIIEQAQPLTLEPLELEAGALCILRRAGILRWHEQLRDTSQANVDAAQELSQQMGGLPLALEQAGAYINDTACGVKRYLRLYDHYRSTLRQIHSGTVPDYPTSVVSAWRISRTMVEQNNPAATELLQLCSYLSPDGIPDELLTQGAAALGPVLGPIAANPVALDQTIRLLRTYSLLNREADRDTVLTRLSIHRIMQEILLDEMDEPTQQFWAERAVRAVALALPTMERDIIQIHAQNCLWFVERWRMAFPEAELIRQFVTEA